LRDNAYSPKAEVLLIKMPKLPPTRANAIRLVGKKNRKLIISNPRTQQVFANIMRAKTNSNALEEQELARVANEAAKITLGERPKMRMDHAAKLLVTKEPTKIFGNFLPIMEHVESEKGERLRIVPTV
jgi:hypothetical protein